MPTLFPTLRKLTEILWVLALTMGGLRAAPYGPDGLPIEWTQPDGSQIQLRVFGDEFYAHTETLDGYTVVFDPASNSYEYAQRSNDGKRLVPAGIRPGKGNPAARGLAKGLQIDPDARKAIWKERYERLAPNERANWSKRVQAARQRKGFDVEKPAPQNEAGDGATGSGTTSPSSAANFAPVTGNYVGLTILVQFPDDPATTAAVDPTNFPTTKAAMEDYCNLIGYTGGGNTGSVRDYFKAQSLNQTDYTQVVTEIVTLPQPRNYYNWANYPTNTTLRDGGLTGRLVLNDAITILKAQSFNFTGLTRDGSNRVVATNVLFAGATSGVWPDGLWPHRWSLSPQVNVGTTAAPIYIYDYQITNAQTASVPIGTFCHENGHLLLKYPDLYDYGGESRGVGNHCLMGGGNHLNGGKTPCPINGYFKDVSGWSNVVDITTSQFFTDALPTTNNEGYRIRKPGTTTEYFLIENRGTGDPWAQYVADKGILIWHIDELVNGNENQQMTAAQHYEVSLEQADGLFDLEMNRDGGDSTDAFDSTYPNFTDSTLPDSKWWNGSNSGIQIAVLSAAGASMDVRFGPSANTIYTAFPNGGESIYLGSTQTITWSANITGNLKIDLFKGGVLHSVLSATEANDGSYSWVVSAGLPSGNDYTIRISSVDNPAYADSSNANFTIIPQPTLADALDTSGLTWTTSGNIAWFAQSNTTKDGSDAAQNGDITHSQSSTMETTLTGPGTMTFWWKVSSEGSYDYLRLYLNNVEQTGDLAKIAGEVDWIQKTVTIPAGSQTVKWTYSKDSSVDTGSDSAWVDQVVFASSVVPEIAVERPVSTDLVDGTASIDCGSINLGSSSSPVTFTVKNVGTANLTSLALTKDGAHSADYTLGSLGATTLAPGASTTFDVTFTPSAVGARTAAIHIASNDANENPFDISLTGTGVPLGTLAVTPAGNFTSSGSFSGAFSATQQYTLTNIGSTSIDWTAANVANWVGLSATSGTLAAGATTTVTVSFTAAATSLAIGNYTDTVTFTNTTNGNGNATRGVSLTVNPFPATFNLGNLLQTYTGSERPITVTTTPSGLAHSVTYAGSPTPPTNVGTYAVVATITAPNYTGTASSSLTIQKASQTITFGTLADTLDNALPFALTATATSTLPVSYTSSNISVATVSGSTVTIVGLGSTTLTASQSGNTNYNAATSVPQTLNVVRSNPLAVTGGPYSVLVGQTLSLNGGGSQPSDSQTVSTYEWDLNNDNTFGDVTGATPAALTYSALIATWGMVEGLNTIQLRITDSIGKTATASTTVRLVANLTWDANHTAANQTDGAGAWLNANQWWDGSANQTWVAGSSATFGNAGAGGAVTLASLTSIHQLVFNSFSGTYTVGSAGSSITLAGGIVKNTGSGMVVIGSPLVFNAPQSWTNLGGGLTSTKAVNNGGNGLTIAGSGIVVFNTVSGIISGGGGITMNGTGRFFLSDSTTGAHSYTGSTILNNGITLVHNNNLGPGNLVLNGGVYEAAVNHTFIRSLGTGSGEVQMTGGASGFAQNANQSSNVIFGNNAAIEAVWGSAYFNPSIFVLQTQYSQGTSGLTFANKIDLSGTDRTIQVSGGTTGAATATISGIIRTSTGTAGIIKTGNGQLNLPTANTYNGVTTISAGPIAISNASALGTTAGNTTIAATGSVNGAHLKVSNNITSAENITITGTTEAASYIAAISNTSGTNALSGNILLSSPTAGVRLGAVAGSLTFSGNISQTGTTRSLAFMTGDGATLLVNNAIANNGGALQIYNTTQTTGSGTVTLKGVSGSGLGATSVFQTGILKLGVTNALNTSANLTLGVVTTTAGNDIGTFDLAGFNQTVNALIGSKNTSNIALDISRKVTNSAAGSGTNTLTVGNGDGSGTFNGVITDGATAKVALTKTGGGTQTLAGSSSYTGVTTITGGTLALGASNVLPNTTAISIGSAILTAGAGFTDVTGTLDVSNTATINLGSSSTLAFADSSAIDWTGGTLNLTGTFVPGSSLRFGTSNTGLTSVQLAKISATGFGPFLLDASGFLTVDATPPTLVSISDDKSGGPVAVNTLVTYTVTFSEDIDASTVTVADFGNAGTASETIGIITETSPGVFTVQVTSTTIGSLQLRINAGATITDAANNPLNATSAITDDTVIVVSPDFTAYISDPAFGLAAADQDFADDSDGDKLPNGLEAWFGSHPGESNIGLIGLATNDIVSTFTHPHNLDAPVDLTGYYEWSPNLVDWYAGDGVASPPGGPTVVITSATVGATTTVTATASGAMNQIFLHAKVRRN